MTEHVPERLPAYCAGSLTPDDAGEVAAHLAGCPSCRDELAEWQAVTAAAQHASQTGAVPSRGLLDRVFERIEASQRPPRWQERWVPAWLQRPAAVRALAGSGAFVALALLIALTPVGSYAQRLLEVFQPREFVVVPVTMSDMEALGTLSQYGEISHTKVDDDQQVDTAAEAEAATGIALLTPASLPASVTASPSFWVTSGASISFTFSAEKAAEVAEEAGEALPPLPPAIDGSSVEMTIGAGVMTLYGGASAPEHDTNRLNESDTTPDRIADGVPQLMVVQAYPPAATSTGAFPADLQQYILSIPGISDELADAIRAIGDPTTSWPIPVPLGEMDARSITVQGAPGTLFTEKSGFGAGVIWLKDGFIFAVGGPLTEAEVLAVANSLQ